MSNNARVVASTLPTACGSQPPEGALASLGRPGAGSGVARAAAWGEIGSAQYFQALAAQTEPDVRMNPLLLKPEADTHSQVVLLGEVSEALSHTPWHERSEKVWPAIAAALDELMANNDVVVIEGAGSPAEINLMASDIVNLRVARHANAQCLLVSDIDKGGAFAHLYGTWALLPPDDQQRIRGFVLNKFRGDAKLLAPAPEMLQTLTGVPTVAVLPMWWQHGLPEEDGVMNWAPTLGTGVSSLPPEGARLALGRPGGKTPPAPNTVAVIAYPRISNLDEFQPLKNVPGLHLMWVRSPAELAGLQADDWVVLPGSKHTSADLAWLRQQGLDAAVVRHAQQGGAVLGICGGLQMLGEALIDTEGIDGNAPGLGLLPLVTQFAREKTVTRTRAAFGTVQGAWSALSGVHVAGYEIHHGQTQGHSAMLAGGAVLNEVMPALAWQSGDGQVLGTYLHGLFECPAVLQALFGAKAPTLETVFDGLADFIEQHFPPDVLRCLVR